MTDQNDKKAQRLFDIILQESIITQKLVDKMNIEVKKAKQTASHLASLAQHDKNLLY